MILNRQRRVPIPRRILGKFLARACRELGVPEERFTVCFVTNREISRWNQIYRGKNRATDVLSFPSEQHQPQRKRKRRTPGSQREKARTGADQADYLGDIAIAPLVAKSNAQRLGRSFEDEVRILVVHAMLHLMGYDHETDTGEMDRRERRVRRSLGLT